jgi:hypothetical protein
LSEKTNFSKSDKESMSMEVETQNLLQSTSNPHVEGVAQLAAAAAHLERTAATIEARVADLGGDVPKVVAAVESDPFARLAELEAKLQAMEQRIDQQFAELRSTPAASLTAAAGRKTLPVAAAHLLAKHGIDTLDQVNGGALDAALNGLSLEQRIAVKSQLMRAGLMG